MDKNKKQEIFNSSFLKKSKKAELTTQQIVILIVLVMSFVVILYFLFRLNLGETSEKEICHNSVVMKGNPVLSKGEVPLNCQRTYVCITKDGSCETMTNPNIKKVETLPEIYRVLADEMADCWWMFGEGKVKYVKGKLLEWHYCSICTQLAFDDSIDNDFEGIEEGKIDQDDFYDYLTETSMSEGGETYTEYFFGTNDIPGFKADIGGHENNTEGATTFGTINLDEQYFVTTGIISEVGKTWKILGAGLGVLAIISPLGWVVGAIVITSGAAAATVGEDVAEFFKPRIVAILVEGDGVENYFMVPTIIETRSETFGLLNCKDILTLT